MAGGMDMEDSLEIRAAAGSGGHTVCASFAAGVLAGFV